MTLDWMLVLDLCLLAAGGAMYVVDRGRARRGDPQAAGYARRWALLSIIAAAFIAYRFWR